jgi:hypothetical protein
VLYLLAYGFLLYGIDGEDLGESIRQAGSSLFTLGFSSLNTQDATVIDFMAAATGPIVIAMMIGFLPTIYSAYLEREVDVTNMAASAGEPSWGPELLSRYSLAGSLEDLSTTFDHWGATAARLRMTHVTYPVLIWVRSARALRHYTVALLAVLDAAALQVSLNQSMRPTGAYRLLIQGGQTFEVLYVIVSQRAGLRRRRRTGPPFSPLEEAERAGVRQRTPWGRKMLAVELAADADAMNGLDTERVEVLSRGERRAVLLTRAEFDQAVDVLRESGFPIDQDLDMAWEHFTAARSRYEFAAYELCRILDATPAPWSGPRRVPTPTIWPTLATSVLRETAHLADAPADPTADDAADDADVSREP